MRCRIGQGSLKDQETANHDTECLILIETYS